jgi:hypothetical protein
MDKSLLVSMTITEAKQAHNCRFNKKHRIEKGDARLTIKQDRNDHHYCLSCARKFIAKDIERLRSIQVEVDKLLGVLGPAI